MHLLAALVLAVCSLCGIWQGHLKSPYGSLRRVMTITQTSNGMKATIQSLDETDIPIVSNDVLFSGSTVTMRVDMNTWPWIDYHRVFKASLAGATMRGSWAGNGVPTMGMTFHKVARATWPIVKPVSIRHVTVAPGVQDEVLDWGGSGRPMLLLAGLGNTAHDFLSIVPDLTKRYHLYSMTRRGFGTSTAPPPTRANYSANRLGDDVIAVIDALHLNKPILVGHSIAGEELSDIATRYPSKVSALVYLEAGYPYALIDPSAPLATAEPPPPGAPKLPPAFSEIIKEAMTDRFTGNFNVPVLAIFADPHTFVEPFKTPAAKARAIATDKREMDGYVARWRRLEPKAKIVVIPNASHYIYISNRARVVRAIDDFVSSLP